MQFLNDTYAEINISVLKENFRYVKSLFPEAATCCVVKADAYGHGMIEVSKALSEVNTEYLATADYSESVKLSTALKKYFKYKPKILCMGLLTDNNKYFTQIAKGKIEASIADLKVAGFLNNFAKSQNIKLTVQLQIDSGMNRTGIALKDSFEAYKKLLSFSNLKVNGVYSHFATSEVINDGFTNSQMQLFKEAVMQMEDYGGEIKYKHINNTGGIFNYRDGFFNMIRPGISLYGYYPERPVKNRAASKLKPVMRLISKVSFIKQISKGESVSYGRKYFAKGNEFIASIPIGYGDGYPRCLTNKGAKAEINGKLYSVVGTVCMDWVMVKVDKNVNVNDEVILMGGKVSAYDVAELACTLPYEITCGITQRVQRVYV